VQDDEGVTIPAGAVLFGGRCPASLARPLAGKTEPLGDTTTLELIDAQSRRRPRAMAVSDSRGSWTYSELSDHAQALAAALQSQGVGGGDLVGTLTKRSREWVALMIAIWRVGAVYLPIDLGLPVARILSIIDRGNVRHLAVDEAGRSLASKIADARGLKCLNIEAPLSLNGSESDGQTKSAEVAYVIFTSGSTGTPKGAMVEHAGMQNHLLAKIEDLNITSGDRVAQLAPCSFDVSVWQAITPLMVGGECHIADDEIIYDPVRLTEFLGRCGITVAQVVPSLLLAALSEHQGFRGQELDPLPLRILVVHGEVAPPHLCREFMARYPSVTFVNAYGVTECSDDVTHFSFSDDSAFMNSPTPIGRPLRNVQLFVLQAVAGSWIEAPVGEVGELFVAGPCVGKGYLNAPRETAEAFARVPSDGGETAIYRTGDLVRVRPDGMLEFIGRRDRQIKLRGHRMELGDIELALEETGLVSRAVAVLVEVDERAMLAAIVIPRRHPFSVNELRWALAKKLPAHMRPERYVTAPKIPLTPNGKLDVKGLSALVTDGRPSVNV
jgi:amino acid adenylation domain-containing protein